ncbi:MAG: hypothetical protein LLG44_05370 [Chloroflexi bacterium]|nr:hypothetical protein [Chloroflexota bacterium]
MDTARLCEWFAHDALAQRIRALLHNSSTQVWLVGGTVRDALLERPASDYDLAVDGGALVLGKMLARALDAPFYPLDSARGISRVLLADGQHIDLADLRAGGIEADLRARDFTINAMAVPLEQPDVLLDPSGGLADLERKLLRAASPTSFTDDPLRILRLVRQSRALSFSIEPETFSLAVHALPGLDRVAMERIRDELLLLLALPDACSALITLYELGAVEKLLPRLGIPLHMNPSLEPLLRLEIWLSPGAQLGYLSAWREHLAADWALPLAADRPRFLILKLAGLLANLPAPSDALPIGANLCLSTREAQHFMHVLAACRELLGAVPPDALRRYLYFQRHGAAGLDGALLAAASFSLQETAEGAVSRLFDAWYNRYEREVKPPALLNGGALCAHLGIAPGPRVGELLEALRRAQVQGLVTTREEAIRYLSGIPIEPAGSVEL